MPSQASRVGALDLPIAAGTLTGSLADPIVDALLAFFGYCLKAELDAKLNVLTPTSADACPTANRYPYDPKGYWVRNAKPALYIWWKGTSEVTDQTLVYTKRERELGVFYVFDELVAPGGLPARAGLMAAVDAAFAKASSQGSHPSFAPTGSPAGTPIHLALADAGMLGWEYRGGLAGWMVPVPSADPRPGGEGSGYISRGFPALEGTVHVWERVEGQVMADTEAARDIRLTLATGDAADPMDLFERYLVAPDGSEPGNE